MDGEQAGGAAVAQTLDQKKEAWKRQYGEILEAKLGKTECVFRPVDLDEWERLQDKIADDKHPASYLRELTLNVTLHPARDDMEALIGRYPAFPDSLCSKLREIGGGKIEISVKKG
ncbi:MAG TPA: hypothetical protein VGP93_09940 [Polyangiaceae bacterium]|jgi:hypothetical protein|nr:hypothetical protein [Polyangiaceae bacterium]